MILIRMTGGLGNQMFQYALYLKLKSLGKEVKLEDMTEYENREARLIMLWVFGIDYPRATREELQMLTDGRMDLFSRIRRKLTGRKSLEYQQRDSNYDAEVLKRDPAYLTGYFQSEKYFEDIKNEVRRAFQFSDRIWEGISGELVKKIRDYEAQIGSVTAVALHIRRGDYLNNPEVYGGICTEEYYQKAIGLIFRKCPQAVFFVFSNDAAWCRSWISKQYGSSTGQFVIVEGTTEDTGYLDLYLMSRCRHFILANSSFSWWGAWLNPGEDKIVIAPARWFGNQDCKDIYTEEMIKI